MRFALPFLLLWISTGLVRAGSADLPEARKLWLRGNYAEARDRYLPLLKDPKTGPAAAIGMSKAWDSEGEYDKALEAVENALTEHPGQADLLARQAEVFYSRGRWVEAEKAAELALKGKEDQFRARWVLAQLLRDRGQQKEADEACRWFVRTYTARSNADKEITDPDELVLVGLAGLERARWHNLADQFQFILTDIFGETSKQDKNFWWGDYHKGVLFAEKYDQANAVRSFDKALTVNPQAAEVFAAKAGLAWKRLDIKDAELFADRALEINPRLVEALRLKADIHLFAHQNEEAKKQLDRAKAVNPRDETTLAALAASLHAGGKQEAFAGIVKEVEKQNPRAGIFFAELADRLENNKHYDEAEKYYRLAIKLKPEIPQAKNGLGLLAMRLGKEDEARKLLEPAFEADNFNVRVFNTLKVLDHLDKYASLETEHFVVRYDPKNDAVLARFLADYLEKIYTDLGEKFAYRPKGKTLVEVFNKHEMFSGRVTNLPDLHTIAACTGPLVAMVSPRDKSRVIAKPFNWNRVLRHEVVHVFNLDQTKHRVPHWLTEGLAVQYESFPMPPAWHTLLAERLQSGELLNLDNILLAFARPKSPDEWQLAYLQSLLYVEYLTLTHGQEAVGRLLAAYAEGMNDAAAIPKACQVSKEIFEKGYRAFLDKKRAANPSKSSAKPISLKQLREDHAKNPDDLDLAARLAERTLLVGTKQEARKLAEGVLAKKPDHPLAVYVKARLLVAGGETEGALALLEKVIDPKSPEAKAIKLLGSLQFEAKKYLEAALTFEMGRKAEPFENSWLVSLAKVYGQLDDKERLISVLKELVPTDADDLANRKKLAGLLLEADRLAEAEVYARQALEIDVLDANARQTLENALARQNKDQELKLLRKLFQD